MLIDFFKWIFRHFNGVYSEKNILVNHSGVEMHFLCVKENPPVFWGVCLKKSTFYIRVFKFFLGWGSDGHKLWPHAGKTNFGMRT